jgi:hypothetical protein
LGAVIVGELLKRGWVPDYLQNFFILSMVLLSFSAANVIAHESGLLAVTVFGVLLANQKHLVLDSVIDFKEHLSVLIISMLFILLAARMDLNMMLALWPVCVGILLVAQFVARPLSVILCGIGTSINFREGLLLAWVAPRGIVAAAVSALFAMRLHQSGIEEAQTLVPLSFAVILGTVLIQGASARFIARGLGLSAADREGVFIVGVDNVSLAIAEALRKQDIPVLLADERWDAVNEARMAGFQTWYGNALSERAEYQLDLVGMKHLLVVSRNPQQSALVGTHYRPEFGAGNIYTVTQESHVEQKRMTRALRARPVASPALTWSKFASLLSQGWIIKATRLSDTFGMERYQAKWPRDIVPLFALTPQGRLKVFADETAVGPQPEWTVIALLNPEAEIDVESRADGEDIKESAPAPG